jgi:hypothetical protein
VAAVLAPPPTGLGLRLGGRVHRALRGGPGRVCPVSDRLRALDGPQSSLYVQLLTSGKYWSAVVSTVLYVGVGVNATVFLAFLLSDFFMRRRTGGSVPWAVRRYIAAGLTLGGVKG